MQAVLIVGSETLPASRDRARLLADFEVAGLSLLRRQMRAAVRAGATRLLVVCPDPATMQDRYAEDPVARVPITWRAASRRTAYATASLLEVRDALESPFWVTTVDRVLNPKAFARPADDGFPAMRIVDGSGAGTGVFIGDDILLEHLDRNPDEELGASITRDLEAPGAVSAVVKGPPDRAAAEKVLSRSLRKPLGRDADGVAAYYLNRPISLFISSFAVATPLTPNMVTAFALLVGLAGAWMASRIDYAAVLVGGLLLQASSILDGVDGEIARLRMTTSTSGEWFDTICDDVINLSFMFGLGWTVYQRAGHDFYLAYAVTAVSVGALLTGLLYRELIHAGLASHNNMEWGFEKDQRSGALANPLVSKVLVGFSYLAKRDLYTVMLVVLLALDLPTVAFLIMATGTLLIFSGYLVQKLLGSPGAAARR